MTIPDDKKLIFGLTKSDIGCLAVGLAGEAILSYKGLLIPAALGGVLMLIALVMIIRLNHRESR